MTSKERIQSTLNHTTPDVVAVDFGTQDSQFCSPETYKELWMPHYKRMNDWIHKNTTWKVFKHSCGAIIPILPGLIESGCDIINPVQINARNMDSVRLKEEFGKQVTFWGGGIDTQKILPDATPEEVRAHVFRQCDILGKDGGFVFNAVHNIQANAPVDNVVVMEEIGARFESGNENKVINRLYQPEKYA